MITGQDFAANLRADERSKTEREIAAALRAGAGVLMADMAAAATRNNGEPDYVDRLRHRVVTLQSWAYYIENGDYPRLP